MARILIADDEPNILMLTELTFQDMGMEVITAINGEEAVQKAIETKPDLIITDVVMPKKTGFEVCKGVREHPDISDTPIIILSAMGDEYNKLTGFEEGADDYVTKPFNVDELKARANALLFRSQRRKAHSGPTPTQTSPNTAATTPPTNTPTPPSDSTNAATPDIEKLSTGLDPLDQCLFGGLPKGSNILVIGPTGFGKSSFSRQFVRKGLSQNERVLFVALDDNPQQIRQELNRLEHPAYIQDQEQAGLIRFVDAYSWTAMTTPENEKFVISGMLELNQLSGVISDAGYDLGQTIQSKLGGRRVIDSISSLFINFDLPTVQRFLSQIARTSLSFGGVTTLFILEEGTVSEQALNNIKYIMDGVLEFNSHNAQKSVRVASMKWSQYDPSWTPLTTNR